MVYGDAQRRHVSAGRARRPPSEGPRRRQLVVRFSDHEFAVVRQAAVAAGLAVGAWVGDSAMTGARRLMEDGGAGERVLLRELLALRSTGIGGDVRADRLVVLVDELIDVLVARLS